MPSSLYECRVMHHRFTPKAHRFVYGMFLFAIDLDDVCELAQRLRLFSAEGANLYSFRERDYLPIDQPQHAGASKATGVAESKPTTGPERSLKARVVAYLASHQVELGAGRVVLLTLPRVLGYLFNPVSFYFCFDHTGAPIATIVEVTNTFREVKLYFLRPTVQPPHAALSSPSSVEFRRRVPKQFYVSPFSAVDVAFDFSLRVPTDRLALQIDDYDGDQRTLTSTLTGRQRRLTDATLLAATVRHPLVTLKIIGLIHWQALKLFAMRVPWFRKREQASQQRELYRPHSSIASTL